MTGGERRAAPVITKAARGRKKAEGEAAKPAKAPRKKKGGEGLLGVR